MRARRKARARRSVSFSPSHDSALSQAAASEPFRVLLGLQFDGAHAPFASSGGRGSLRGATYNPGTTDARPRLALSGLALHAFAALLRFLYTGTSALERGTAVDVLLASEKFGVHALRSAAELYLPRVLRDDNACGILTAAVDARASGLASYATAFVLRHFDGVLDTPGFLRLSRPVLALLLNSDDMSVVSEERLLKAVLRWGLANTPSTPKQYAGGPEGDVTAASPASQGGAFPAIPLTVVPALKGVLGDLFPALRLPYLEVPVLRSAAVGAIVPSDLTLAALFEKLSVDAEVAAAEAAARAGEVPGAAADDLTGAAGGVFRSGPSSMGSSYSYGMSSGAGAMPQAAPAPARVSSVRPPSIISGDNLLDMVGSNTGRSLSVPAPEGSSGVQPLGGILRRQTAASAYLTSARAGGGARSEDEGRGAPEVATRSGPWSAEMGAGPSGSAGELPSTVALVGGGGGGATPAGGAAGGGKTRRRRYGDLLSNPYLSARLSPAPPSTHVAFESHALAGEVSLSNGGRTVSLPSSAVSAGFEALLGPANGCEGRGDCLMLPTLPALAVRPTMDGLGSRSGGNGLLPPGRLAWELVFEDSDPLLGVDPEGSAYRVANDTDTARGVEAGYILPTTPLGERAGKGAPLPASTTVSGGSGPSVQMIGGLMAPYPGQQPYYGYPQQQQLQPWGAPPGPAWGLPHLAGVPQPWGALPAPPTGPWSPAIDASTGTSAFAGKEPLIRPFELAVCLLPAGAVGAAAAAGRLRSGSPADYGVVWMATNRGHVYARALVPAPAPAVPGVEGVEAAPPAPMLGPLALLAVGCPWAVSSYLHVAVDAVTGDVGLSISNGRAGFDECQAGEEEEAALEEAFGPGGDASSSRRARAYATSLAAGLEALLPSSEAVAPRPPPPAFSLLATADARLVEAAPRALHTPDPSLSARAQLHALVCRVPLRTALYGGAPDAGAPLRGLQLAIFVRSTSGLVVTLVPPADGA
jgi:hypothetical protein